jgi:hypothetical protein
MKPQVDKIKELIKAGKITEESFGNLVYEKLGRADKEFVDNKFAELMKELVDNKTAGAEVAIDSEQGSSTANQLGDNLGNGEGGGSNAALSGSTSEAANTSPSTQTEAGSTPVVGQSEAVDAGPESLEGSVVSEGNEAKANVE